MSIVVEPGFDGEYRRGEPPETLDDIPDKEILKAVQRTVRIIDCPECGEKMIYHMVSGRNTSTECGNCGETYKVVG